MSDGTKIEWTHIRRPDGTVLKGATWNIITGCSVVSEGCKHCYAMKLSGTRLKHTPSRKGLTIDTKAGPVWNGQVRFNGGWLEQPLSWKQPRGVFVCAHGDLFHDEVPKEWVVKVFAIMAQCPQHTFQILTKRPWNAAAMLGSVDFWILVEEALEHRHLRMAQQHMRDGFMPNVWIGTSIENQKTADERIPGLLNTPAAVRFLSCEPLLGPIVLNDPPANLDRPSYFYGYQNFRPTDKHDIDWVIVGGESGPGARPMHPDWVRSLRNQCANASVAFFFKQWGAWAPNETHPERMFMYRDGSTDIPDMRVADSANNGETEIALVGKKAAGRMLDGVEYSQFPGQL